VLRHTFRNCRTHWPRNVGVHSDDRITDGRTVGQTSGRADYSTVYRWRPTDDIWHLLLTAAVLRGAARREIAPAAKGRLNRTEIMNATNKRPGIGHPTPSSRSGDAKTASSTRGEREGLWQLLCSDCKKRPSIGWIPCIASSW
jgi:hypothetical protein